MWTVCEQDWRDRDATDQNYKEKRVRQTDEGIWTDRRIALDGGRDLINDRAGCAREAVIHDFSWKEDPSMQIQ